MSKAKASMVKTVDLIELDQNVSVWYSVDGTIHKDRGEVHALDAIGIGIYHPVMGTQFHPWTSVLKVVLL